MLNVYRVCLRVVHANISDKVTYINSADPDQSMAIHVDKRGAQ